MLGKLCCFFKMCTLYVIMFVLIIQFDSTLAALCRTSNDHKNYTCLGFRFNQLTVSKGTRQQLLRVRIYDCKETEISDHALMFPNIESLTVSCGINNIHINAFQNMNHLQELDLGSNALNMLPQHLFDSVGQLQALNLSKNNFESLTENIFEGLHNLKQLNLSYNMISEFHFKVFDKTKQLEEIYLNNNRLNFIAGRLFNKLRKLHHVDLSYNNIKNIENVFVPTYKLTYLNLSHNIIEDLPVRTFKTNRLEILDLSFNKLTVVYEDSLGLDLLRKFYLQNNKITFLEIGNPGISSMPLEILNVENNMLVLLNKDFVQAAKNLASLYIDGNPWDCKCLEQMEIIRHGLSLETIIGQESGEQPLCVIGNLNECKVDLNNLTFYYKYKN